MSKDKAATATATGKSPWSVDVDVHLVDMNSDPPRFNVYSCLQPTEGGDLVFNNNRRPGFNVNFHLHDPNETGFCFPPNSKRDEAVWSQCGDGACPTSEIWEVFEPKRIVEPHRMTLVVYNQNPSPAQGKFGYVLRVTNDGGDTYRRLDPGALNQNGRDN